LEDREQKRVSRAAAQTSKKVRLLREELISYGRTEKEVDAAVEALLTTSKPKIPLAALSYARQHWSNAFLT
jgi:hypothetical protein